MAFELIDTTFAYDGRTPVLRSASLTIEPGAFVNVTGPSGAGKSTLLRLLCRLELPQAGTIRYMGLPLSETNPDELRRKVAYVQQTPTVISGSVRDNLLLPFSFATNSGLEKPSDTALQDCLDEFLLAGIGLDTPAPQLSVGQKQRICLIRALLLGPEAMLFDEPTSALDPESAALVTNAAFRVHERGGTVLYISHGRDLDGRGPVQRLKLAEGKAVLA